MKRSGLLFAGMTLAVWMTGCASPAPPDTRDADVAALKSTEAAWVKDAALKDVEKWAAYYTDDASVLVPEMPIATGKDAIRTAFKPLLTDPNFNVTFSATKVDVAKSGDIGYTQGAYELTLTDAKTKKPMTEKGKYLTIYRKQADGSWKAVQDTFMADAPPPSEAKK